MMLECPASHRQIQSSHFNRCALEDCFNPFHFLCVLLSFLVWAILHLQRCLNAFKMEIVFVLHVSPEFLLNLLHFNAIYDY